MLGNSGMAVLRSSIPYIGKDFPRLGDYDCPADCHVIVLLGGKLNRIDVDFEDSPLVGKIQ
jgi:hypothetical protein